VAAQGLAPGHRLRQAVVTIAEAEMGRRRYRVEDDSVTVSGRGKPKFAGKSITKRGEDIRRHDIEPGRYEESVGSGGSHRVVGKSTGRDVSGVAPTKVIDEKMPYLI
jgi:hypothetical protein